MHVLIVCYRQQPWVNFGVESTSKVEFSVWTIFWFPFRKKFLPDAENTIIFLFNSFFRSCLHCNVLLHQTLFI
ncbi:MAG: hypothetical protein EAZ47_01240 [Bacteroidetes bacterium]|nr:MAG: hypothetical protein EAY72_05065 [Bacteroidota bacterium]TAE72534.1 MAG: hypothetical protein EAY68_00985 [Bacteroidota bacterium]TAF97837.1 MAG: hypothetical protein EAZ47_01240 [Bacteroidota bacterium]